MPELQRECKIMPMRADLMLELKRALKETGHTYKDVARQLK